MIKSVAIDYLSFTRKTGKTETGWLPPSFTVGMDMKPDVGHFGYRQAVKYECGLQILYDGGAANMGNHYIYSGRTIANLMSGGVNPEEIINWHMSRQHSCRRIDLAVDVKDDPDILPEIEGAVEWKKFGGSARSASVIKNVKDGGITVYMGKRASPKFVRIYNKAVESGTDGYWTRIEAEIKGEYSNNIARHFQRGGLETLSSVAQSVITDVCTFDCNTWKAVFNGETLPLAKPQVREPDTEEWLLSQCARALARYEREHPERRVLDKFWQAVQTMLGDEP